MILIYLLKDPMKRYKNTKNNNYIKNYLNNILK